MSECKQCPYTVGDSYQRDCEFPDCMGGWEEAYKDLASKNALYPELIEALEDVLHDPCFNTNCDEELWNRISELLKRAK